MDLVLLNDDGLVWVFFSNSSVCDFVGKSDQYLSIKIQSYMVIFPVIFSFVDAKWTVEDRAVF